MTLQHIVLGGSGPVLVLLHANGFNSDAYRMLARSLTSHFMCIAIDLPGHGLSQHCMPRPFSQARLVAALLAKLADLQLRTCCVFGHSWGGALALMAEAQQPGTFAAIYCYEPVVTSPGGPGGARQPRTHAAPPDPTPATSSSPGSDLRRWNNPLAALSIKRRGSFPSREAAARSLGAKPPFSSLHPACLADYLEGGLQRQEEQQEGGGSSGGSSGPWRLVCRPEVEALVFETYFPLPVPDLSRVRCPARVATGEGTPGMHQVLFMAAEAVSQQLPCSQRVAFGGLGHLGPLEAPGRVGADVLAFLLRVLGAPDGAAGSGSAAPQTVSRL